jgi:hypothetical protein
MDRRKKPETMPELWFKTLSKWISLSYILVIEAQLIVRQESSSILSLFCFTNECRINNESTEQRSNSSGMPLLGALLSAFFWTLWRVILKRIL